MVIKKSLYQISRQAQVPEQTLRRIAQRLFGRSTGDFSTEEVEQLRLEYVGNKGVYGNNSKTTIQNLVTHTDYTPSNSTQVCNKNMYGENAKITIHDYKIRKIDAYISTLFPQWLQEPDRLSKIAGMLNRSQKKAIQVYEDMWKDIEQLDSYEQLMGDEEEAHESESDDF